MHAQINGFSGKEIALYDVSLYPFILLTGKYFRLFSIFIGQHNSVAKTYFSVAYRSVKSLGCAGKETRSQRNSQLVLSGNQFTGNIIFQYIAAVRHFLIKRFTVYSD